jgi:hypothetical protein
MVATTPFPTRTQTAAQCIRSAMDLEQRIGRLYLDMAVRSEGQPWLRGLLRGLAAEEEQHAKRIRLLERVRSGTAWTGVELARVGASLRRAHERIDELERHGAAGGAAPIQATTACEAILAVELGLGSLHAEMMAGALVPEVRDLFDALARQDAHHQAVARDAMRSFAATAPASPPGGAPVVLGDGGP